MPKKEHPKFWMAWNPEGRQPRFMHYTRFDAEEEAKRLASENPGFEFFVLKAVSGMTSEHPMVAPIKLQPVTPDEIPF